MVRMVLGSRMSVMPHGQPVVFTRNAPESNLARYRRKAEECRRRAEATTYHEAVEAWLELASIWNDLADSSRPRTDTKH